MCIAIAKAAGQHISEKTLRNCWDANPDGAGYCFVNTSDEITVRKFMSFKHFYEEFSVVDEAYGDVSDMLIHFRITSRGATRIDNCHPFQINSKMAFIHNGTITSMPFDKEHQHSDTFLFNELILQKLPEGWEDNEGIRYLIEDMIGSYSKIAMLHAEKGLYIYNEEKGVWHEGVWYSNTSYKDVTYKRHTGGSTSNNYSDWDWEIGVTWQEYQAIKAEKEAKEKEEIAKKLIGMNNQQSDNTITVPIEKKEEIEVKEEVEEEETEFVEFVECEHCFQWVDELDIFVIDDKHQGVEFVCEDCIVKEEELGTEHEYVTFTPEEFEIQKVKWMRANATV
jgi:glutamine amidotransferase